MSLPFRVRPKPKNNEWVCNEDPAKVDAMYRRLLGDSGDLLLTEEVKWLAITHKSFDQGRRGFNDRLSYLGTYLLWSPPFDSGEKGGGLMSL
jgi:large subunit ribosomal protein L15